jgi:hypothetical protein
MKTYDQTQNFNQYDKQTLIELETKLQALDYRIDNNLIDLDSAEVYFDLQAQYHERILDLTDLIKS